MKGLIPTKEDFSLPWHDKILLTLDLIYASIQCICKQCYASMHLLKNICLLVMCTWSYVCKCVIQPMDNLFKLRLNGTKGFPVISSLCCFLSLFAHPWICDSDPTCDKITICVVLRYGLNLSILPTILTTRICKRKLIA